METTTDADESAGEPHQFPHLTALLRRGAELVARSQEARGLAANGERGDSAGSDNPMTDAAPDPDGVHCGGVNCAGGHTLPYPWDETQRRSWNREPCVDKGEARPRRRALFVGRPDPDERATDPYDDDYTGPRLDW
ncbi:hypothetical protein [Kitasatospora sp. NPDC008115]|uniref:hypothetical protein n=1 Tax=Kitasatospora sp. NPDC008115 TaxID=3364022 RepID=UPI0036E8CD0C